MEKTTLIIPAAGKSSRFPGTRPKWMLTHPSGCMMLNASIKKFSLVNVDKIVVVVLNEHLEENNITKSDIVKSFLDARIEKPVDVVVLENETKSQPETVYKAIKHAKISGSCFIKDSDNTFEYTPIPENEVVFHDLNKCGLIKAHNKSYVSLDSNMIIDGIVEKKIVSPYFCVGGYSFKNTKDFCEAFEKLSDKKDLFVSHLIFDRILSGLIFLGGEINNPTSFHDWGTLEDWNRYRSSYGTLFLDLDGVLVKNSGRYVGKKWGSTGTIEENVESIRNLYQSGKLKIVITTSRSEDAREKTIRQLEENDIPYDHIIFDLPHAKRIVVNDYASSNVYRTCDAINIKRNSSNLKEMISGLLRCE